MAYTTIDDPTIFFNTKLYTGNGSTNAITGVGFQPDWVWIKERNGASGNIVKDSVRGATPTLVTNSTGDESDFSAYFTSFDSDGFTLPNNSATNESSSYNYAAWNWKAGTTSGISGSPSITPSGYSFSQTAGFSIIGYTGNASVGATIPHGLGVAPAVIFFKRRDASNEKWSTYHHKAAASSPEDVHLELNDTTAASNDDSILNDTAPSSTLITMKTSSSVNSNSIKYVAYCFSEIKGYSSHGSYTGNGNANGAYVHLGFRPAWIMIKRTDNTGQWFMHDNKRVTFNVDNKYLAANDAAAEQTFTALDMLSNGFKLRTSGTGYNASGGNYVYLAFAESPFVNSSSVPNNAR